MDTETSGVKAYISMDKEPIFKFKLHYSHSYNSGEGYRTVYAHDRDEAIKKAEKTVASATNTGYSYDHWMWSVVECEEVNPFEKAPEEANAYDDNGNPIKLELS